MQHTYSCFRSFQNNNTKCLFFAFFISAMFTIIEIIGGIISGSLALLADAGHMLTDTGALLFAILAIKFSKRAPNMQHTFGLLRLTTLAAFVNAILLIMITIFIFFEAFKHFYCPQPVTSITMMYIAIIGLMANILTFFILQGSSQKRNLNIRAAALHVLGDVFGSIGAITAALIMLWTHWTPIDPILSILVSCLILYSTWKLLKESIHQLLEGTPFSVNILSLKHNLCQIVPEICNVHHVHIWQIGDQSLITLHVQVNFNPFHHDTILNRINFFLKKHYQIVHATIQIEYKPCSRKECLLNINK